MTSAVVHASVLGPPLFLLYINEILNVAPPEEFSSLAGDIKIVYFFETGLFTSTSASINKCFKSAYNMLQAVYEVLC